jgi:hypothetical protein
LSEPLDYEENPMGDIPRKPFGNQNDALAARRLEGYIVRQRHGAGTWPDKTNLPIDDVVAGGRLSVTDMIGTDQGGMERHIMLHVRGRLIVTLVYNHHSRELVRTF